jgi:DnaA-homolog protein
VSRDTGPASGPQPPAEQLPLALRYPADQRFEGFVAASPAAPAQVQALANGASDDWLYVVGAAGVGKTHLAIAACAAAEAASRRSAYLPLASAAGRLRAALDALDDYAFIALDGLDAVAGGRDDEVALFDFHNRARDAGTAVLYTGRVVPDALPLVLPDLRSRLSQCTRIALQPLDDDGRRDVLRLRAQRRGLAIDEAAIEWLLKRVDRDLASLAGLLDRLDRASLAAQRRITVPFLRQVLGGVPESPDQQGS